MLAMNYRGPRRVRIDHKPMPEIMHPQDAIVRVTRSCICGSDLHLYNGSVPDTRVGMTFGHEVTGVVEQLGQEVEKLKLGDHILVPFNIACGKCVFCQQELYGNCHESNSQATAVGGIFGYSHTAGGYNGGQAEYVRVPYADVGPTIIPPGMDLDDAVLLTDVVPTGYQAAEMGGIQTRDTVVVFGAGPVGIMAARCAWLFGAGRVIVIDCVDDRLQRRGIWPDRHPRPDRKRGEQRHHHQGEPGIGKAAFAATDRARAERHPRSETTNHPPHPPGGCVGCLPAFFGEARWLHKAGADAAVGQNVERNHYGTQS